MRIKTLSTLLIALAVAAIAFLVVSGTARSRSPSRLVEYAEDGRLERPSGYRKWIQVGTPLTPNDLNGGQAPFPEFHVVYIDPESFEHYEKTGDFRDGTVLVKELTSVGTKSASSGRGYFMGDFTGLEVSIKDSRRYASEPGHWAYYSFGHEYPLAEAAPKNAVASCSQCHQANADQDLVFTQYYPVLREAQPDR